MQIKRVGLFLRFAWYRPFYLGRAAGLGFNLPHSWTLRLWPLIVTLDLSPGGEYAWFYR